MEIIFNEHATENDMKMFKQELLEHLTSRDIAKTCVLEIRQKRLYFTTALTHEEDTFILQMLANHSRIIKKVKDHIAPE